MAEGQGAGLHWLAEEEGNDVSKEPGKILKVLTVQALEAEIVRLGALATLYPAKG